MKERVLIALSAIVFGLLGLALYRLQGTTDEPLMNPMGVVSFSCLGAALGCLMLNPDSRFPNFWDRWFR